MCNMKPGLTCLGRVVVCRSLFKVGGRVLGEIHIHGKCNCNNVMSDYRTDQSPIHITGI